MRSLLLGFPLFLAMSSTTRAGNFITVDYPDPTVTNTQLFGINSAGQAVGNYVDAENAVHGFSYDSISGKFTPIDFPDALFTSCGNISENGDIVGRVITSDNISHGYLLRGGVFTLFDAPDPQTTGSVTFGINPSGDSIVGDYCLSGDCLGAVTNHGFLLSNVTLTNNGLEGTFMSIDFPQARTTSAFGVNDSGQVVGRYNRGEDNTVHGYMFSNEIFETIDVPGAILTVARSITSSAEIVGHYDTAPGVSHGFVRSTSGEFSSIDVPNATSTLARGINANHTIVGSYNDADRHTHGFILN